MVRKRGRDARANRHAGAKSTIEIAAEDDLEEIIERQTAPLVLVLDGVQDPHNLGACLRTADAAGVHAVISPRHRASPLTETAVRIACGGAESVPFVQVTNLARTLKLLQDKGLWLVGTADDSDRSLWDLDLRGPTGIVMGAEGKGLRRLTRDCCDHIVHIPMAGRVECLNVSVATGVCLFEAVRQRRATSA